MMMNRARGGNFFSGTRNLLPGYPTVFDSVRLAPAAIRSAADGGLKGGRAAVEAALEAPLHGLAAENRFRRGPPRRIDDCVDVYVYMCVYEFFFGVWE